MQSIHEFISLAVGYIVHTVSNSGTIYGGQEPEDIVAKCMKADSSDSLSYLQKTTLILGEATTILIDELKAELKAELIEELKAELTTEILMEVNLEMEELKTSIKSAPSRKSNIIPMEQFGYMANPLYGDKC